MKIECYGAYFRMVAGSWRVGVTQCNLPLSHHTTITFTSPLLHVSSFIVIPIDIHAISITYEIQRGKSAMTPKQSLLGIQSVRTFHNQWEYTMSYESTIVYANASWKNTLFGNGSGNSTTKRSRFPTWMISTSCWRMFGKPGLLFLFIK